MTTQRERERQKERETEKERERERERDKETERQRDRETKRQSGKETESRLVARGAGAIDALARLAYSAPLANFEPKRNRTEQK